MAGIKLFHRLHPPPADGPPHVIHKRIHKRRPSGTGHLFRRFSATVLVFNVLLDNTQYTLTVSGHPVGQGCNRTEL